jgi:hypothetical protein
MDYGKVLSRAWQITWRWKVLWILGFLASLGSGTTGGGGTNFYSTDGRQEFQMGPWRGEVPGPEAWAAISGIILALVCLGLIIAIAIWVVSIIARGGLVAGVQQVEEEGDTTFGQAWRVGVSRFWTLFGVAVLAALPIIILGLAVGVLVALGILLGVGLTENWEAMGIGSIVTAALCGGVFCCGLILLGIVLDQIRLYAERAAILEGLGWLDAFKRGWEVLKENLGPTVVLWLIFFFIGLVLAVLIGGVVVVLALPFIAVMGNTDPGAWIAVPACCGGLLAVIVFALISAVVQTFTSATWTLAYREFTGWTVAAPAEELPAEA